MTLLAHINYEWVRKNIDLKILKENTVSFANLKPRKKLAQGSVTFCVSAVCLFTYVTYEVIILLSSHLLLRGIYILKY